MSPVISRIHVKPVILRVRHSMIQGNKKYPYRDCGIPQVQRKENNRTCRRQKIAVHTIEEQHDFTATRCRMLKIGPVPVCCDGRTMECGRFRQSIPRASLPRRICAALVTRVWQNACAWKSVGSFRSVTAMACTGVAHKDCLFLDDVTALSMCRAWIDRVFVV
jgi:hypothetical protein